MQLHYALAAAVLALALSSAQARPATATKVADPDTLFAQAASKARTRHWRDIAPIAARIPADYPLRDYLAMWRLLARLQESAADPQAAEAAEAFARQHAGEYVVERLRTGWALLLAGQGYIEAFEKQRSQLAWNRNEPELRCWSRLGQLRQGAAATDWQSETLRLLTSPRALRSQGCRKLAAEFADAFPRKAAEVVAVAASAGSRGLAAQIARDASGKPGSSVGASTAAALDRPAHLAKAAGRSRDAGYAALAAAPRQWEVARDLAERMPKSVPAAFADAVWAAVASEAARHHAEEANALFGRVRGPIAGNPYVARPEELTAWQVRAALRAQDWKSVARAISRMTPELASAESWRYWFARAMLAMGKKATAERVLGDLAAGSSFYAQMAREQAGLPPPVFEPAKPDPELVARWASNKGFARAFALHDAGLYMEGNREWNWQLRGQSQQSLYAAAEWARTQERFDRMISTAERLRPPLRNPLYLYPMPQQGKVVAGAQAEGLDPDWVYGLMRQESRFVRLARSSVGARGLMQVMPATARYVARQRQMAGFAVRDLNDPDTNIRIGTAYLRMVFDDLDGSLPLATGAYNAGPLRSRRWRASLQEPVEGAIWAETIPFNETRTYVQNVLANMVEYARVRTGRKLLLRDLFGTIIPKPNTPTELP